MTSRPLRSWEDAELLEAVLGPLPDPARRGALRLFLEAGAAGLGGRDPEELALLHDLDERAALALAAVWELQRRWRLRHGPAPVTVRSGADVAAWLEPRLLGRTVESFWVLCLDAQGALIHAEEVSQGTLTASLVHPREVFHPALLRRAAAVVVAHNHPSGDPTPSEEDRATTRRLQRAGRLLGIEVLDHLVLGTRGYRSFLEEGWL